MGEASKAALRVDFERSIKLEFHGARVSSDAELFPYRELDHAASPTESAAVEMADLRTGNNIHHLVKLHTPVAGGIIRFTTDGRVPTDQSRLFTEPLTTSHPMTIKARTFLPDGRSSLTRLFDFEKPHVATKLSNPKPGLVLRSRTGAFRRVPPFDANKPATRVVNVIGIPQAHPAIDFALEWRGYIKVQQTGMYRFSTSSDDGSRLWIDGQLVVDNDGPHSSRRITGSIALEKGFHSLRIGYFQATGAASLQVDGGPVGMPLASIPASALFH